MPQRSPLLVLLFVFSLAPLLSRRLLSRIRLAVYTARERELRPSQAPLVSIGSGCPGDVKDRRLTYFDYVMQNAKIAKLFSISKSLVP